MHELSPSPTATQRLFPPRSSLLFKSLQACEEYTVVMPAYSGQMGSAIQGSGDTRGGAWGRVQLKVLQPLLRSKRQI